ncbi:MAG: SCP2 sterol-binding domain-containing protein [Proteobacteria bacterium]|nr:SCP2 sterol-binding domain-containing protein [Pseudomonadota bacterium]
MQETYNYIDLRQRSSVIWKYTAYLPTSGHTMLPIPEKIKPVAKKIVGIPGRLIPYSAQKRVLSIALNEAFREPLKDGELEFLEGSKVRIKVTDLQIDWLIRVGCDQFEPIDRDLVDDVCISGESPDFLLLATRQADPDTLFFQRKIRIEGDTELGLGIKNTMDSMDWEDLPTPLRKLLQAVGQLIARLRKRRV